MVKKNNFLFTVIAIVLLTNCMFKIKDIPAVSTNHLPLASADYSVGGETSGKACLIRFLFIPWSRLFGSNSGYVGDLSFGDKVSQGSAQTEATYDALSKIEGSTFLVNPKYDTEVTSYIIGFNECVTVKARAITLKNGPVPNAH